MAYLALRRNPLDELFDFRRDFEGVFNRFLTGRSQDNNQSAIFIPPLEAWTDKQEKAYHVRVALPGVEPQEVRLTVQGNTLTISGEHKEQRDGDANPEYQYREFSYGRFERTIVFPDTVNTDNISAEYKNGVLEIVAPIAETAQPKQIEVKSSQSQKSKAASS